MRNSGRCGPKIWQRPVDGARAPRRLDCGAGADETPSMRHELARRRALLTAALGLVRLRWRGPTPPSVVMLAHWLNSWPGVGAVVIGMNAQGFNVELKEFPDG